MTKRLVLLCLALSGLGLARAQQPVMVTTQVFPPFSTYLSDYISQPNRIRVRVQSAVGSPQLRVRLIAKLYGMERGIKIATDSMYKPPRPIVLEPGVPVDINNDVSLLRQIFDVGHMTFEGITKEQILRTGGLPEGTYRICVRVLDFETGAPLSGPEPAGCTGPFQVRQLEPPTIIMPTHNSTLPPSAPQNVVFRWTLPVGAPIRPNYEYRLKIIELVPDTRNPEEAMASSTVPPLFERTVRTTQLVYGPSEPPLVPGKRYAARVTVSDPERQAMFRNNGRSPVVSFRYGTAPKVKPPVRPPQGMRPPEQPQPGEPIIVPRNTHATGELRYAFKTPIPGHPNVGLPLSNVNIRLMLVYVLKDNRTGWEYVFDDRVTTGRLPRQGKVLGATRTDAQGRFVFNFLLADSMKVVHADTQMDVSTIPDHGATRARGPLRLVARIIVDNYYYLSPDKDVMIQPGEEKEAGVFVANVREYWLDVTAKPAWLDLYPDQAATQYLENIRLYMTRLTPSRPEYVPADEGIQTGEHYPPSAPNQKVVGSLKTSSIGVAGHYKRLVKSRPHGQGDKYGILGHTDSTRFNYQPWPRTFSYDYWRRDTFDVNQDNARYNAEFHIATVLDSISCIPLEPRICGSVWYVDEESEKRLEGATVRLHRLWPPPYTEDVQVCVTGPSGGYSFDHLDTSARYQIKIKHPGFADTSFLPTAQTKLKMGERRNYLTKLRPAAKVTGKVVNEQYVGINAKVSFRPPGITLFATAPLVRPPQAARFSGNVASGDNVQVIVDPDNEWYFSETLTVKIPSGTSDMGYLKVYKRLHRIQVLVQDDIPGSHRPIANARVWIKHVSDTLHTNEDGETRCEWFPRSGEYFTIRAEGPDGQYFFPKEVNVHVPAGKETKTIRVRLAPATEVTAYVSFVNQPVESACVYLDGFSFPVEAYTAASGWCTLRNVPVPLAPGDSLTFCAAKSGFIGSSQRVRLKGSSKDTLRFTLGETGLDLTQLLGFRIEVSEWTQQGGDTLISGAFVRLPKNSQFRLEDSFYRLRFSKLRISRTSETNQSGQPLVRPFSLPVATDHSSVRLLAQDSLHPAILARPGGAAAILVDSFACVGGKRPTVMGKVAIDAVSFKDPNILFPRSRFYIARPLPAPGGLIPKGVDYTKMPTIAAGGADPFTQGTRLNVVNDQGGNLEYTVYSLAATAHRHQSWLHGDTVRLVSTLHVPVKNRPEPTVDIADVPVVLHKSHVVPAQGRDPVSIAIQKWRMVADSWELDANGFRMDGQLQTGKVNVPFTGLTVNPNDSVFQRGEFNLDELTIGGIVPLNIDGDLKFYPDQQVWMLCVLPDQNGVCGHTPRLDGFGSGQRLTITTIHLFSDGQEEFYCRYDWVVLHDLVSFQPQMIVLGPDNVELVGDGDLHVPRLERQRMAVSYVKQGSQAVFKWQPMYMRFFASGCSLEFRGTTAFPQQFPVTIAGEKSFRAFGEAYEKYGPTGEDVFRFRIALTRNKDSTWVRIWDNSEPGPPDPYQIFYVSRDRRKRLERVTGSLQVAPRGDTRKPGTNQTRLDCDWDSLMFAGDLKGTDGNAAGRLEFTVKGEISASGEQIGVKNVDVPFGGIGLQYIFAERAMVGQMSFQVDQSGFAVSGGLEVRVDDDGWYFLGWGGLIMQGGMQAQSAVVFGDHDMNATIRRKLIDYSFYGQMFGRLPDGLPSRVAGFYFEGSFQLPIIIPSGEFFFLVCNVKWQIVAGADVYLGMNFADGVGMYQTGVYGFAKAALEVGVTGGFLCASAGGEIIAGVGFGGTYWSTGKWEACGRNDLLIQGWARVGCGLCDATCANELCEYTEAKDGLHLGIKLTAGSDQDAKLEFE